MKEDPIEQTVLAVRTALVHETKNCQGESVFTELGSTFFIPEIIVLVVV